MPTTSSSSNETASAFIARKNAEWTLDRDRRNRRNRLEWPDVNREATHIYRRDAWTFQALSTYSEAVAVLERLTHVGVRGVPAVPQDLPAVEYRLAYYVVGRKGRWVWGNKCPVLSDGDAERLFAKARTEGTLPSSGPAIFQFTAIFP